MKPQNILLLLSLMLVTILAAGCGQSTVVMGTPSSIVPTLLARSATPSPIFTTAPSVTLTPTAIPTLSVEKAHARLLELLANNGNCRLPCLWGINPGKSTYQEALDILIPFRSISDATITRFNNGSGSIFPDYPEGDFILETSVGFLSNNQIVSHIAFSAGEAKKVNTNNGAGFEPIFDSQIFGERLGYYILPQVLSEQGIPTSVMIAPHGGAAGFGILLLYPERGLLIDYTAQMERVGSKIRGCPANAHVDMELFPPGKSDSFFEFLKQTDWAIKMNYYKPLENITSMSVDEFYKIFSKPTDQCIETPAKLWPTSEPGGR
jgi:hypothetical protein